MILIPMSFKMMWIAYSLCKITLGSLITPVGGLYAGPFRRVKFVASPDV